MEANGQEESPKWFETYINREDDLLESTRGNLMVTATVLAGLNFQTMVNPPGGVWQGDACSIQKKNCTRIPGTAVLEHVDSKRRGYLLMVYCSIVSFYASMTVILLVVSGLRLRNRVIAMILSVLMIVAVMCTMLAFFAAVLLVQFEDKEIDDFLFPFYLLFFSVNLCLFVIVSFRIMTSITTVMRS